MKTYQVLARKYRPKTFAQLKGQEHMVQTLENAIRSGRIAHAFLLTGVRGVGKTTTARLLAKGLNCMGPNGDGSETVNPCGVCDSCQAISKDSHMDIIEFDAASQTGVDNIREIIEGVSYRPIKSRYKVYIIDEVHMLSKSAFNALLKTLEEPPLHAKFIFATTEIRKVPVTIRSRCQRFDLRRLDIPVIVDYFKEILTQENLSAEEEALWPLAKAADGSMRDGLSLLDQALNLTDGHLTLDPIQKMLGVGTTAHTVDLLESLLKGDASSALKLAKDHRQEGIQEDFLIQDLLTLTHQLTLAKMGVELDDSFSGDLKKRLSQIADMASMAALHRFWQLLTKGHSEIQDSQMPGIVLEMVLLRTIYAKDMLTIKNIGESLKEEEPAIVKAAGQVNSIHPVKKNSPKTFEDMIQLFYDKQEPLLASHLEHDINLVSYQEGHLKIRIHNNAPADFKMRIQKALQDWTGIFWTIESSQDQGKSSIVEKRQEKRQALINELREAPLVKQALDYFPDSKIESIDIKGV